MEKRVFLVLCAVILALFISGCGLRPGPDAEDGSVEEIYRGTTGLEMEFVRNQPPSKIYDLDVLNLLLELKNKGTSDLTGSRCRLYLSGYDDTIIRGMDTDIDCGDLEEKTIYNPEGGYDTAQFTTDLIDLSETLDVYRPNLLVQACYEYETNANAIVCIDPHLYEIGPIERACSVRDVTLSGGQGAPVSVSRVDVRMMKEKVQFKIHVSNVGGGTVLSQDASIFNDCPYRLDFGNYNIVDYDITMSGATEIKCSPEIEGGHRVRLVDDRGLIICTFRTNADSAYETPLRIRFNYNYLDSISKRVDIIKTPE